MKVLFLLSLVFITYSNSDDIQYIAMGTSSLKNLNSPKFTDYFYFPIDSRSTYNTAYLLLFDTDNGKENIYYCSTSSYPSDATIKSCSFKLIDSVKYSHPVYYYKIPISPSASYIIIEYTGKHKYWKVKARSYFMEKILANSYDKTKISTFKDTDNYFYMKIGNPSHDYLYFNFINSDSTFDKTIYFCQTDNNPEYDSPSCSFRPIDRYGQNYTYNNYENYYKADIRSYSGEYIIVKFQYNSNYNELYLKSSYNDFLPQPLSTVAIVLIVIGSVVFVGIIIILIYCCCKKRAANNNTYEANQSAVVVSNNPDFPLMEKNNMNLITN